MKHFGALLLGAILFSGNGLASIECPPVPGLEQILRPGAIVLLGEMHGTVQGPRFLSEAVCTALGKELAVTVGLEIPGREDASVQRFLQSAGETEDISRLLSRAFWSRDYQDGRSSQAMLDLLQSLREYSIGSPSLAVRLIDDPAAPGGRDRAMASNLSSAIAAAPNRIFLVLTGNIHNRLAPRGTLEPMGYLLSHEGYGKRVISLDMGYADGSAWVCFGAQASDCGEKQLRGRASRTEGIELFDTAGQTAYSGRYYVGSISASPPAKESLSQRH